MKKKKGFTLIELMAVVGLTTVFGLIVLQISLTSGKLFSNVQIESQFNDNARLILGRIEDDLKTAKNIKVTSEVEQITDTEEITTEKIKIDGTEYTISGGNLVGDAVLTYTKGEGEEQEAYAYIWIDALNKLVIYKSTGFYLNPTSMEFDYVKSISVERKDVDGNSKSCIINLSFENSKENASAEFSDVVTPRNK